MLADECLIHETSSSKKKVITLHFPYIYIYIYKSVAGEENTTSFLELKVSCCLNSNHQPNNSNIQDSLKKVKKVTM